MSKLNTDKIEEAENTIVALLNEMDSTKGYHLEMGSFVINTIKELQAQLSKAEQEKKALEESNGILKIHLEDTKRLLNQCENQLREREEKLSNSVCIPEEINLETWEVMLNHINSFIRGHSSDVNKESIVDGINDDIGFMYDDIRKSLDKESGDR